MDKIPFEWDSEKDRQNKQKHGIGFSIAQYAFVDPKRVILSDSEHSEGEPRFYCLGKVGRVS